MKKMTIRTVACFVLCTLSFTACGSKENANKPEAVVNTVIASGSMPFSDGEEVTAELCLTKGIYYNDTMEEYVPSIYTYGQNYEGSYAVRTVDADGTVLFETGLETLFQDRGETFNFSEKFTLEAADYNGDGCPDFTIRQPQSSSTSGYLLLTVRKDGTVERLCSQEIPDTNTLGGKWSAVLKHNAQADGKPITGCFYNNAIGEEQQETYVYQKQSGLYGLQPEQ